VNAVTYSSEDALLSATSAAARRLLERTATLSPGDRVRAIDAEVSILDPSGPARVRQVASYLRRFHGLSHRAAVERALSLSLADGAIARFKRLGGAGGLGSADAAPTQGDAGSVVGTMFQNLICSDPVRTQVTEAVGRNEGANAAAATSTGFEAARAMAPCTPEPLPLPPPTPAPAPGPSLVAPVALGVLGLAAVGGMVWWASRAK
jgi:hypothetical protein